MAPPRKKADAPGGCSHPEFAPNFDTQQVECTSCGAEMGTVGTSSSSRTGWTGIRSSETVPPRQTGAPRQQTDPQAAAEALVEFVNQIGNAFRKRQSPKPTAGQDRAVSLWALGLVPVIFACLHIMIVSRGDAQTLRSLVQNLNITALVLAVVLPLGSTVLLWVFLFFLGSTLVSPPERKIGAARATLIVGLIAAFVAFFAMPARYLLVNAAILAVLALFTFASRWTLKKTGRWVIPARKFFNASAFVWAVIFIVGPLMIWLGFLGIWLPQERLTLRTTSIQPVYILSEDDRWTKYMDSGHKVRLVPTEEVTGRELIDSPESNWRKPLSLLWPEWWSSIQRWCSSSRERQPREADVHSASDAGSTATSHSFAVEPAPAATWTTTRSHLGPQTPVSPP